MSDATSQEKPVRWRRRVLVGRLAILFLTLLSCGGWLWKRSQRGGWTVAQLEERIQAELPPLCDRATAEAWFNRHGIGYGWIADTTADGLGHQTMPQMAGLRSDELGGMLRGEIWRREADVSLLFDGRISVYLFFDKRGRLAGHLVQPFLLMW